MRNKGLLGLGRVSSKGPLTVKQSEEWNSKRIEQEVLRIIDQEGIDADNPTQEDVELIVTELADAMFTEQDTFPTALGDMQKETGFKICMGSSWATDWEEGVRRATTQLASPLETVIVRANGCKGLVDAENIFATNIIFSEDSSVSPCFRCRLAKRVMSLNSDF